MPTSAVNPNTAQQVSHAVDVKSREDLVKLELQHRNQQSAADRQMQLLAMKEQAAQAQATREHQRAMQAEGAQQEKDRYAEYQQFLAGESEKERAHAVTMFEKDKAAIEKRLADDRARETQLTKIRLQADFLEGEAEREFEMRMLEGERELYKRNIDLTTTIQDMTTNKKEQSKQWSLTIQKMFNQSRDKFNQIENISNALAPAVDAVMSRVVEGTMSSLVTNIDPLLDFSETLNEPVDRAGNKVDLAAIVRYLNDGKVEVDPEAMEEAIQALHDPNSELYKRAREEGITGGPGADQQQFAYRMGINKESVRVANRYESAANMISAVLLEASTGGDYQLLGDMAPLLTDLIEFQKMKDAGLSEAQVDSFLEDFRGRIDESKAYTLHSLLTSLHEQMSQADRFANLPSGSDTTKEGRAIRATVDRGVTQVRSVLANMRRTVEGMVGAGKMPSVEAMRDAPALLIEAYRSRDQAQLLEVAATLPDDMRDEVVDMISGAIEEAEQFDLQIGGVEEQLDEIGFAGLDTRREASQGAGDVARRGRDELMRMLDELE